MKHVIILAAVCLAGCSQSEDNATKAPEMPRFADENLAKGRGIWMGTCRNCHLLGISGAPAVTDFNAWEPRIAKGKPALYHSALNGVKGPDGNYRMPPRGGNSQLKDEQVRMAVDYMVASVKQLNGQ
ncbi:MAG: c-type cytochrome [Candidatus Thiodiazotropha sp.]